MGSDEKSLAVFLPQSLDQVHEDTPIFRIEVSSRFICKYNARAVHKSPDHRHSLALPAGQLRRIVIDAIRKTGERDELLEKSGVRRPSHLPQPEGQLEVLPSRELRQ